MKKNFIYLHQQKLYKIIMAIIFLFIANKFVSAQTWQSILNPHRDESYTSGVAVAGKFYAFGNTKSFSTVTGRINRLVFGIYTSDGQGTFKAILDGNDDTVYNASDMQAGYSQFIATNNNDPEISCDATPCNNTGNAIYPSKTTDNDSYFFMTGWYTAPPSTVPKMFILKTTNDGSIVWARTGSFSGTSGVQSETGISVESCPNGDVIVVSKAVDAGTGLIFPIVTRLNNNGKLIWRYAYRDDGSTGGTPIGFEPEQSIIFNEDLFGAGNQSNPVGIAVTGQCFTTTGTRLFVMRIGYNGELIWRKFYTTANAQVGFDIMCEDKSLGSDGTHSEHFILTGLNNPTDTDTANTNKTVIASIDAVSGAFDKAWLITGTHPAYALGMYAQSIYQSLSGANKVVLSGGVYKNSVNQDVFISEFNIATGSVSFTNTFPLTRPNFSKTETVYATDSSFTAAEQGYFIATNNINMPTKPSGTNGHAIKTDLSGQVNTVGCTGVAQTVTVASLNLQVSDVCTMLDCYKLKKISLEKRDTSFTAYLCGDDAMMPKNNKNANIYSGGLSWDVYPNPIKEKMIKIKANSNEIINTSFIVTDINGTIVARQNNLLNKGTNIIHLTLNNNVKTGMYKISCIINGNANSKNIFIE